MGDPLKKRQVRRHDHIAKDLRTPKYRPRVVKPKVEVEHERRWRRYHIIDDYFLSEGYHPLDNEDDKD